jgi:hypothetical protein
VSVRFEYDGPIPELATRELLGRSVATHHEAALRVAARGGAGPWTVRLGSDLLFDAAGLRCLAEALERYAGGAGRVELALSVDDAVFRDYYSLGRDAALAQGTVRLPALASRNGAPGGSETVTLALPASREAVPIPGGLGRPCDVGIPHALLLPYRHPFDLLFANQIALGSELRRRSARSPWTWARAVLGRRGVHDVRQRVARAYRDVHATAEVHPTAVIEGAVIGPRARVGAHCVVRYSVVSGGARLHDGAKVELSVVGEGAWLMHDLVLFRSVAERGAFLIHGPYQFSYFQRDSGAFATILMDYRPDGRPIQVKTPSGLQSYGGAFLGSIVGEGAKTLGGSMLAPGRVVPPRTWLSASPDSIHRVEGEDLPTEQPIAPPCARRRTG